MSLEQVQVIHEKLWIGLVIHAETVTVMAIIHAETVTDSRRNGDATNKKPIATCNQYTCI